MLIIENTKGIHHLKKDMMMLKVVFRNFANAPNINGRKSWDIFQDQKTWTAARNQPLQSQKAQGKLSKRQHRRGCANPRDQELEDRSAKQEPMKEHSGGGQSHNWPAIIQTWRSLWEAARAREASLSFGGRQPAVVPSPRLAHCSCAKGMICRAQCELFQFHWFPFC